MPAKISAAAMKEIDTAFAEYHREVSLRENEGTIQPNTAKTYLLHSENFVRWLRGEFVPGAKNL